MSENAPLLELDGVTVAYPRPRGQRSIVVDGVAFQLRPRDTLGVIGETGSGKSLTLRSILGLIPAPGTIVRGSVRFDGRTLTRAPDAALRKVRGAEIGFVPQDPMRSLDPLLPVSQQYWEALRVHRPVSRRHAVAQAQDVLDSYGIANPGRVLQSHPYELSGGMAQRVAISIAMACTPRLLLADEPTTGLDVTVQRTILDLIIEQCRTHDMALVLVSHDAGVIANYCERVIVMHDGVAVEQGYVDDVWRDPAHEYTRTLLAAMVDSLPDVGREARS